MAERESKAGSSIPWANVTALLVAVAGGLSLLIEPLVSSRPQKGSPPVAVSGAQDVDARLWQDPLRVAIEDFQKSAAGNRPELIARIDQHLRDLRTGIPKRRGSADYPRLIILPVLIPGGPYSEDNERRLRTRQAVVSGLGASGFTPLDGQRLGYFLLPPVDPAMKAPVSLPTAHVVPYEWFVPRYSDAALAQPEGVERILLLWVRDDLPGRNTLDTLRELGEALDWDPAGERVVVLGPGTSTSLTTLLRDDAGCTRTRAAP